MSHADVYAYILHYNVPYIRTGHIVIFVREKKKRCEFYSAINSDLTLCTVFAGSRSRSAESPLLDSCPRRNHRCTAIRRRSETLRARIRRFCTLIRSYDRIPARPSLRLHSDVACRVCVHSSRRKVE